MASFKDALNEKDIKFIQEQKMFFVSTAPKDGRINISPKGLDGTLKILDNNTIIWLNYFGSGNETAAHLLENPRITLMFCAYENEALILRIYAKAIVLHERDYKFQEYIKLFDYKNASRQIFELDIQSVNSSCGMGVPLYKYISQRDDLVNYYDSHTKEEYIKYMKKKNQISFDGKETKLFI